MPSLTLSDLARVTTALPCPVRELMQEQRVYLAGGFIRHIVSREQGKTDIDLFGLQFEAANEAAVNMAVTYANDHGVGMDVYDTPNAISLIPIDNDDEYPVQFIHRWPLDCAEKIIKHFDFTVCAAVVWWNPLDQTWNSLVHKDFYTDLDQQQLVYTGSDEPGGSLLRAFKYSRRGYRIQADSVAAIVEALINACQGENAPDVLTLLREIDPLPDAPRPEKASTIILDEDTIPF
jgi:hypothetical protein